MLTSATQHTLVGGMYAGNPGGYRCGRTGIRFACYEEQVRLLLPKPGPPRMAGGARTRRWI